MLRMDTVLMGIYYPCDLRKHISGKKGGKDLRRVDWMPRPRIATAKGYAKFLNVPDLPVTAYLACTTLFTKLPAFRNAKLASFVPQFDDYGDDKTGTQTGERSRPTFPVIVFSHGLGGSRLCYSAICGSSSARSTIPRAMAATPARSCMKVALAPERP